MAIKYSYDSEDEVPEKHKELYTEVGGKWVVTGITGIKTTKDTGKLQTALEKERTAHKATKGKLAVWDDLEHDAVVLKLDRFDELEAAAGDKLDKAGIEEMVTKRVEGKLKSATAPLERQIAKLTTSEVTLTTENARLKASAGKRQLQDVLRPLLVKAQVRQEHHEDVFMYADAHLQALEEGGFAAKDGVGVTPGLDPTGWLEEMLDRKPGWVPGSLSANARPGSRGGIGGDNPWARDNFNTTKQGAFLREHGRDKADAAAKAAGTVVGGLPAPAKPTTPAV